MRLALVVAAALSLACTSVYVDLPSPDPATIDVANPRTISSQRCGFQLLLLIPIGVNGRLDRVWTDLRNQAGRDVIGDVSLRESWKWAFVGTLYCSELVAKAYPKLAP